MISSRILSFQQMVNEADPYYNIDKNRPWCFEFSNRRRFLQHLPVYEPPAAVFDDGIILDYAPMT